MRTILITVTVMVSLWISYSLGSYVAWTDAARLIYQLQQQDLDLPQRRDSCTRGTWT